MRYVRAVIASLETTSWRLTLSALLALFGCSSSDTNGTGGQAGLGAAGGSGGVGGSAPEPALIEVAGDSSPWGAFDPSIEYAPDGTGWMSYSGIRDDPPRVTTQLARTDDGGASWIHVAELNPSTAETVDVGGSPSNGWWWHEVSTLVYDDGDPAPERRWKLYWHEYFHDGARQLTHGWIAVRYAGAPQGPWSARERLFGTHFTDSAYPTLVNLNQLDDALGMCVAYSEPGAAVVDGALYLALLCPLAPEPIEFTQVLVRSLDHGTSWQFVAVLADETDAAALGNIHFSAADLVRVGGTDYLVQTPVRPGVGLDNQPGDAYSGCDVFRFSDLATGQLERDGGQLTSLRYIEGDASRFRGACSFDERNQAGGIVLSQFYPETDRPFRLLNSFRPVP